MTNATGREAHFNGEHNVADATPAERAKWAEECAYCARIFRMEGGYSTPSWAAKSRIDDPRRPSQGTSRPGYRAGTSPAYTPKPASEKQVSWIKSMLADRDLTGTEFEGWEPENYDGTSGGAKASQMIDVLKPLPRKSARPVIAAGRSFSTPAGEISDGMYRKDGVIYKVQLAVHGSGRPYAKRLVIVDNEDGTKHGEFEYTAGAVRTLTEADKMSLEDAKEFGALYGFCCKCGATLTDENSIAAGIGPICSGKGWA